MAFIMWHAERHKRIRDRLASTGRIAVDEITAEFGVSRETVRRDLVEMEALGALRRVRGGAVALTREDTDFRVRTSLRLREKRAIAHATLRHLQSGMTLFMDAGTTSTVMAETLAEPHGLTDLTIITNAFDVARLLAERPPAPSRRFRVLMLAGEVRHDPMESFGPATINDIQRYRADVALLAPWGIDARMGAMNYFIHGAEIARAMVRNADRTFVLADHSKIGAPARSVFCSPGEISLLITDPAARNRPGFSALQAGLAQVLVADGPSTPSCQS